jgi:PPOX class probable F420-dependent enzyme
VGQAVPVTTSPAAIPSAFAALGEERFVSLTTFRASGEPVSTPVWVARDGDALVVTTPADSGKVKRLRRSADVELRPCSRTGTVRDDVEPVRALAEVLEGPRDTERPTGLIRRRYGVEYRVVMAVEALLARGRKPRVILRVTARA